MSNKRAKRAELPASTMICLTLISEAKLEKLQELIGWRFKSPALLAQAVTHASCETNIQNIQIVGSNEKLEHLGDKVVGLAVCGFLHKRYPEKRENFYSLILTTAVSNSTLSEVATAFGLKDFLIMKNAGMLLGKGTMADTLEAICGALFLDGGSAAVDILLEKCLFPRVEQIAQQKDEALNRK